MVVAAVAAVVVLVAAVVAVAAAVAVVAAVEAEGGNHETKQNHKLESVLCRRLAGRLLFSVGEYAGNDCTKSS